MYPCSVTLMAWGLNYAHHYWFNINVHIMASSHRIVVTVLCAQVAVCDTVWKLALYGT